MKEYKERIKGLFQREIFLDNIFPIPKNSFNKDYLDVVNFWRDNLDENIIVPWEIFLQACRGYNILERNLFSKEVSPLMQEYRSSYFSLLKELKENIFRLNADEHKDFQGYFETVKGLSDIYGKENHKPDGYADERLVASALYRADVTGNPNTIITNDKDISKLVAIYSLHKPKPLVSVSFPLRIESRMPIRRTSGYQEGGLFQ